MTLVTVLGDGSTIPHLNKNLPIILLHRGEISFGIYNEIEFRRGGIYIDKPSNYNNIFCEVHNYVNNECLAMIEKKHPIHILCPRNIAIKMKWFQPV